MGTRSKENGERFSVSTNAIAGAAIKHLLFIATRNGRLVNAAMHQCIAGLNGTSIAYQVEKNPTNGGAAVNMLSTAGVTTLAGGANTGGDSGGIIATGQTGVVSPIISATDATRRFKKGDAIFALFTPTGTYSATLPTVGMTIDVQYEQRPV